MDSRPDSPQLSRRAFLSAAAVGGAGVAFTAMTAGPAGALLGEAKNKAISPLVLSSDLYTRPIPSSAEAAPMSARTLGYFCFIVS